MSEALLWQVWLDYARVVVCGLWKNISHQTILANKAKVTPQHQDILYGNLNFEKVLNSLPQVGPSMINRSWGHVHHITTALCRLLLPQPPHPSTV